ncbi:MAG: ethanolamine ammonia-lyase [Bacteroidales bacterium 45-6]|nr:MAG: ethanolamine ammonia-lyase [Bacteroidales bacterium 45-6]
MNESPQIPAGSVFEEDNWRELKRFTDARIALGHTGASLPTKEMLKFSLSHASARDSVHMPFEKERIAGELEGLGFSTIQVNSQATNRQTYLTRPDLGRLLSASSGMLLADLPKNAHDLTVVVADGLSSKAVHRNAIPMIQHMLGYLAQLKFRLSPVVIAEQARVGLGDAVGEIIKSTFVAILIGERPGLSSPDSLSVYLTYKPHTGRLESERNCISNIRPEGLSYEKAAFKLAWLLEHASLRQCTGIELKDNSDDPETFQMIRPNEQIEAKLR